MPMLPLVPSSDSHVFEPPDLWQTRIDASFRDRAPRIERIDGGDHVVVEADQIFSGIGLISNAGARFEAPETISARGRFEDVHRGGYDPEQHLEDMALDGVAGEVLYPSQGLFYFKVADPPLMSAIFRAYNDWLAEFCRTDPARLKGIAMINLDDVEDGLRELERRASRPLWCDDHRVSSRGSPLRAIRVRAVLGRRRTRPATEPAHRHATAGQDPRGRSRDAARRQQPRDQGVYPALSMCDMIFSGVFERHPRLTLAIVEFELAWAPNVLSSMDYTRRRRMACGSLSSLRCTASSSTCSCSHRVIQRCTAVVQRLFSALVRHALVQ
jgi:hypothetical protein